MKHLLFSLSLALCSVVLLNNTSVAQTSATATDAPTSITWLSFDEAMELNKKEPRKWIIDVYTDWCGWCKRMDATTFKDPKVVNKINEDFYAVKLDGEYKKDITVHDKTFSFVPNGRRGYHELPAELMQGKMSYPTMVFMNEEVQVMQPIPGYQSAENLLPILVFLGDDIFKKQPWEEFQKEFKSADTPN